MPKRILKWPTSTKIVVASALVFVMSSLFMMGKVLQLSQETHDISINTDKNTEQIIGIGSSNTELNRQNARALEILEEATSPESQAQSDARLAEAIKLLDCNHQRTVQRAVDALVAEGKQIASASVMTPQCVQYFVDNPTL